MYKVKGSYATSCENSYVSFEKTVDRLEDVHKLLIDCIHKYTNDLSSSCLIQLATYYSSTLTGRVHKKDFVTLCAGSDTRDSPVVYIHEISSDRGVIYSDGKYTLGAMYANREYRRWEKKKSREILKQVRRKFKLVP